MPPQGPTCRCGHPSESHDHLRRGTDCSVCGAEVCARFRKARATSVLQAVRESRLGALVLRSRPDSVVIRHPRVPLHGPTAASGNPPSKERGDGGEDDETKGIAKQA